MKVKTQQPTLMSNLDSSSFFLAKTPGPACRFFDQNDSQSKLSTSWKTIVRICYVLSGYFPLVAYVGYMVMLVAFWNSDFYIFGTAKLCALTIHMITWGGIIGTLRGTNAFKQSKATHWQGKFVQEMGSGEAVEKQALLLWAAVRHVVIIPNYNEGLEVLTEVLRNLSQCEEAHNMIIVLAMEEKEAGARAKSSYLEGLYAARFSDMLSTFHPQGMAGELPGKSSNVSWAFRDFQFRIASEPGFCAENTTVTVMDADSFVNKKFFSILTYKFLKTHERDSTIWQSPILNYRNYYSVPIATRCTAMSVSMHELGCLNNNLWFNFMFWRLPFSTYSMAYTLANHVGGWDSDVVAEDHHMYFKCNMYGPKGYCNVDTIHVPMLCESVATVTEKTVAGYSRTLYQRYQQAVRHSLGFGEISYIVGGSLLGLLSPFRALLFAYKLMHMHYFVAIPAVCLTFLQIRSGDFEFLKDDPIFALLLLALLPSSCVLLFANNHLISYLSAEGLMETPSQVHGEASWWSSTKVQVVYECLVFSSLSSPISIILHYVPSLAASWQLVNMKSFVYVVAAKGLTAVKSEENIVIKIAGGDFIKSDEAKKGVRSALKSLV